MNRDQILAKINELYDARIANDVEALSGFWAEGATTSFAGDNELLGDFPGSTNLATNSGMKAMTDLVTMRNVRQVQAIVEDNKAAIVWRMDISIAGRAPVDSTICDIWEFDDSGKIRSLEQFADTAKLVSELRECTA